MPESSFTAGNQIVATEIDGDSPIDETLMSKLKGRDVEVMDLLMPLGAPGAVGAGSNITFNGDTVITVNQNLSGIHYYNNFTLNTGITLTVTDALMIIAKGTITIAGIIDAIGEGGAGGGGVGTGVAGNPGEAGVTGRGGAGGGASGNNGGNGGGLIKRTLNYLPTIGGTGIGPAGTTTADEKSMITTQVLNDMLSAGGGGGGGGAGSGIGGGRGGGAIILIAPTVDVTGGTLSADGLLGGISGSVFGGSAGGGGGAIIIKTKNYTAGTNTVLGGAGRPGGGGGSAGGDGSPGVIQIDIF